MASGSRPLSPAHRRLLTAWGLALEGLDYVAEWLGDEPLAGWVERRWKAVMRRLGEV